MAANFNVQPRVPPTEAEVFHFARQLYASIWEKFRVVLPSADVAGPSTSADMSDTNHSNHAIYRAVISEQLLLRDFLKHHIFIFKKEMVLGDLQFVTLVCGVMCNYSPGWDFYKKLTRCTAVVAEVFLYRFASEIEDVQLEKAPDVWNVIFKLYFAGNFGNNGGWDGWASYCTIYNDDLFLRLDGAISLMKHPMDDIPLSLRKSTPEVYFEMHNSLNMLGDYCTKKRTLPGEPTDSSEVYLPSGSTPQSGTGPIAGLLDLHEQMSNLSSTNSNGVNGKANGNETVGPGPSCAIALNLLPPTPKVSPEEEPSMNIEQPENVVVEQPANVDPLVNLEQPSNVGQPVNLEQPENVDNPEQPMIEDSVGEPPLVSSPEQVVEASVSPRNLEEPESNRSPTSSHSSGGSPDSRARKRSSKILENPDDEEEQTSAKYLKSD